MELSRFPITKVFKKLLVSIVDILIHVSIKLSFLDMTFRPVVESSMDL